MLHIEHCCAFVQGYLLLPAHSFLQFSQAAVVGLLYSPPPYVYTVSPKWLLTQPACAVLPCLFCLLLVLSPPRWRTYRLAAGCQAAAQIQMACNSNGKASSKMKFHFSSFPLHAHMGTGKLFSEYLSWETFLLFSTTTNSKSSQISLNYLIERQGNIHFSFFLKQNYKWALSLWQDLLIVFLFTL